jgi:hypothetical protein
VLPTERGTSECIPTWGAVVAWCALEALGWLKNPAEPQHAAAALFDSLRLREPLAECFSELGLEGEERWRAAARVRAALAHSSWGPGAYAFPVRPVAPLSWVHDPDVAWLIGVHEHEGIRYFNKEAFERLLWWMALPALLAISAQPETSAQRLKELEGELQSRFRTAAAARYRVESLLERA